MINLNYTHLLTHSFVDEKSSWVDWVLYLGCYSTKIKLHQNQTGLRKICFQAHAGCR